MEIRWGDILKIIFSVHEKYVKAPMTHEDSELYFYMAKEIETQLKTKK